MVYFLSKSGIISRYSLNIFSVKAENNVTEKNNSLFSMGCLREQQPSAIILKINYKKTESLLLMYSTYI